MATSEVLVLELERQPFYCANGALVLPLQLALVSESTSWSTDSSMRRPFDRVEFPAVS